MFALTDKGLWPRPWRLAARWTGPIFSKELRVASRRTRNYRLRFAYVVLLTIYLAAVWIPSTGLPGAGAMSRAQMQVVAKTVTQSIIWFQFFGVQIVVLLLMSTAISEEVQGRTLGALMTTPLSSHQVVMNKFWSRLFQVLLLVAVSLPMLAIVRVLGGIEWRYIVVSLSVTAATVIFVGSVSLFFSSLCRRAYLAVILSFLSLACVFGLVPILVCAPWQKASGGLQGCVFVDPYVLLMYCGNQPGATVVARRGAVAACCLLLLLGARLILAGTERLVGGLALRRAMGEPVLLDRLRRGRWRLKTTDPGPRSRRRQIQRVVGPPLIWKELTCTLSGRQKFTTRLTLGIEIVLIAIAYLFPAMISLAPYEVLHVVNVLALLGLGALLTIMASATAISAEREARTWPLLLLTPLTDREILAGKVVGVLRRCGSVWLLLLAYAAGFAYAGCFHPLFVVQVAILMLSVVLFLTGTGFYFGSRFRRPTEAVAATLVLAGVLWCAAALLDVAPGSGTDSLALTVVPLVQAFAAVDTTLVGYEHTVRWFHAFLDAPGLTRLMLLSMLGYLAVSLVFAWSAVRAFRRRVW